MTDTAQDTDHTEPTYCMTALVGVITDFYFVDVIFGKYDHLS